MDISSDQFVNILRSALHYLYDPDKLRHSPLAALLELTQQVDAFSRLQKILIDGIEAMQPGENEPAPARAWLLHDVLFFRYVRGYERDEVSRQLGISNRQLSRDQRTAIEVLAQHLWKEYQLEQKAGQLIQLEDGPDLPVFAIPAVAPGPWAENLPAEKPSSWKATLQSVMELVQPLAWQSEVNLTYDNPVQASDGLAPQQALRHSLLNALGVLIPLARHGAVTLMASSEEQSVRVEIQIERAEIRLNETDCLNQPNLRAAQEMIEQAGGVFKLHAQPTGLSLVMVLPTLAQTPVLVMDDNRDTIQLFQRYAQGSRYSVVGATHPEEFFKTLEAIRPRLVLIDVMMPELDGWDLLLRLRQERSDKNLSIIICSILPQAGLAEALGANGFLQKPVLPQDFLRLLDQHIRP